MSSQEQVIPYNNPYDYPVEKLTDAVRFLAVSEDVRRTLDVIKQTVPFLMISGPEILGLSEDATQKFYTLRARLDSTNVLTDSVRQLITDMCNLAFQLCEERGRSD